MSRGLRGIQTLADPSVFDNVENTASPGSHLDSIIPLKASLSGRKVRLIGGVGSGVVLGGGSGGGPASARGKGSLKTGPEMMVPNNPNAPHNDPTYFYWLYGFLEFRMHDTEEEALKKATKQIDRLVHRLRALVCKGQLLFDIIATRKHIATGIPHRLGASIYKYVETEYWKDITTSFVGITDNTARRVARDVFCRNTELSKQKYDFSIVDNLHMFIIYPATVHGTTDRFTSLGPAYVSVHELCKSRNPP